MSKYNHLWELNTIPDPEFYAESGRRARSHGPRRTNVKLEPCPSCKQDQTAVQRRKAHCAHCNCKQIRKGQ